MLPDTPFDTGLTPIDTQIARPSKHAKGRIETRTYANRTAYLRQLRHRLESNVLNSCSFFDCYNVLNTYKLPNDFFGRN